MKAFLVALGAGLFACSGAAEIPDTPDLTALQLEYSNPTATLDTTSVEETLAELPPLGELEAGFRASGYATNGVDDASDSESEDSNERVRIQGSIKVTIRCPGSLVGPDYDASTNGTLALTLGVAESKIKRGVGGRASGCKLRGDIAGTPVRVEVDGPIAFDLGSDIGLRDHWQGRLLMLIRGSITIEDLELDNLSARWTEGGRLEYLHRRSGNRGSVVAQLDSNGITIRDHDTVWTCTNGQACVVP